MGHMKKMSSFLDLFVVNIDFHIAVYSYVYSTEMFRVCEVVDKGVATKETILGNWCETEPADMKDDWRNPAGLGTAIYHWIEITWTELYITWSELCITWSEIYH